MNIADQIFWLLVIASAVASISWTITQEEIFREPREFFAERSKQAKSLLIRKLFYIPTCEFCLSHWVAMPMIFITGFRLIFEDWRGYMLSFFVTTWIANQLMSLFRRLRVVIKKDNLIAEKVIKGPE